MVFPLRLCAAITLTLLLASCASPDTYGIGFHGGKPFTGLEQNDAFAIESGKLARQLVKRGMPPSRLIAGRLPASATDASFKNVEGEVKVLLTFDKNGVPALILREGSARPELWESVYAALSTWRLQPVVVDGTAREVTFHLTFEFQDPK